MRYADVISLWPSCASLARDLGLDRKTGPLRVRAWKRRNRIPPQFWTAIEEAAAKRGFCITVRMLALIASAQSRERAKREPAHAG